MRLACRAVGGMVQEKGSRECSNSWIVLYAQCMHSVPVHCLLGFLFRKVMQKHKRGEVEKQSII